MPGRSGLKMRCYRAPGSTFPQRSYASPHASLRIDPLPAAFIIHPRLAAAPRHAGPISLLTTAAVARPVGAGGDCPPPVGVLR